MEQQIEVPATWESIATLMDFADEAERCLSLTFDQGFVMRLVIEEIATNIVKYGYDEGVQGAIHLSCACEEGVLRVVMRDHSRPFDPRAQPDPDLHDDLSSREVGGLGIYLVREYADHIDYSHDTASGWNELVVYKGPAHAS